MILNAKFNDTAQKMLWAEPLHACKRVRKIMATVGSTKNQFEIFYGYKPKVVGLLSYFGCIPYVMTR